MNGCIRKFFPKKTNFDIIENDEIEKTIKFLNNKSKKCLGFRTSLEVVLLDDSNFLSIYLLHLIAVVFFTFIEASADRLRIRFISTLLYP